MSVGSRMRTLMFRTSALAALRGGKPDYGWTNFGDTGGPIPLTLADTHYQLTNDAQAFNDTRFALHEGCNLWDPVENKFDFTCLSEGDVVKITFNLGIVNLAGGIEKTVACWFRGREGTANEFVVGATAPVTFKGVADHGFWPFEVLVTMDDSEMINSPAMIEASCNETDVTVNMYNIKTYVTSPQT